MHSIMRNEKGQAFDVFKLLIAAVVAIAILSLLMPIIGTIIGIFTKEPTTEARTLLNDLVNKPGTWKETPGVTFSSSNPTIAIASLVEGTTLSADQVCFSLGDFSEGEEWEIAGDEAEPSTIKLRHLVSTSRLVKLGVICTRDGGEDLADQVSTEADGATLDKCACTTGTCCAVVLQKT